MLRKPTEINREFLTQEIRRVLPSETSNPSGLRRVQVIIPSEGTTWLWVTKNATLNVAEEVGPDRGTYKGAVMPAGDTLSFMLLPSQTLWAAVKSGSKAMSIIVEYI